MTRAWATRRPPHVKGLPSQRQALERELRCLNLSARALAILGVLGDMSDGAGFAYPSLAKLVERSGYSRRSVFLALRELQDGDDPLVVVYPLLRDPARRKQVPRRARQGQGHNIYRLGARLRVAAGLRELDVVDHIRLRAPGPQTPSVAPPRTSATLEPVGGRCTPEKDDVAFPGDCTPQTEPIAPPTLQVKDPVSAIPNCTPRTRNGKALGRDGIGDRLVGEGTSDDLNEETPDTGNGRPLQPDIPWPDTTGLGPEAAILADLDALAHAGLARRIKGDVGETGRVA